MEQQPRDALSPTAGLHWILGPVGAGKSTLALALARKQRAVRMNLDAWMSVLFRPDRPELNVLEWYAERTERCVEQIWQLTEQLMAVGTSVVLELGLIQQSRRAPFLRRLDESGYPLTIYMVDAPRDVRRERVERRNREQGATFSMVVPPAFFELASELWEPLTDEELIGRDVRYVNG